MFLFKCHHLVLGRHARPGLTSRVEVCPQQTPLRRCTVSLSYRFTLLSILLLFHLTLPLVPVSLVPFSSDVQTARKSLHYPSLSLLSFHPTILSVAAPLPTSIKSLKLDLSAISEQLVLWQTSNFQLTFLSSPNQKSKKSRKVESRSTDPPWLSSSLFVVYKRAS